MFSTHPATSIMVCPAHQRREALLQLAAVHYPAQQAALQQALVKASTRPEGGRAYGWPARQGESALPPG